MNIQCAWPTCGCPGNRADPCAAAPSLMRMQVDRHERPSSSYSETCPTCGSLCIRHMNDTPAGITAIRSPSEKEQLDRVWWRNAGIEACMDRMEDIHDRNRKLERGLKIANLKNASSLANNLCPDHRDKQNGRPCLACEIERLQKAALSARAEHWVYAAAEAHYPLVVRVSDGTTHYARDHLTYMLNEICNCAMSPTKACRWLGWVQASLYFTGIATIEELKAINKAAADKTASDKGQG